MKKHIAILTTLVLLLGGMPAFAGNGSAAANEDGIDYLALVNKLHPLPEGWEEALPRTFR